MIPKSVTRDSPRVEVCVYLWSASSLKQSLLRTRDALKDCRQCWKGRCSRLPPVSKTDSGQTSGADADHSAWCVIATLAVALGQGGTIAAKHVLPCCGSEGLRRHKKLEVTARRRNASAASGSSFMTAL